MNGLISVIIPVYNVEKFLDECVLSVLNQSYENLEIILVNDGSTDSSPLICDKYAALDKRVRVVHKENGGLSSARNAGLDVATGECVTFLDSDDSVAPKSYQRLYETLKKNNAQISKMCFVSRKEGASAVLPDEQKEYLPRVITCDEYLEGIFTYKQSCSFCDKMFNRELFEKYRFVEGRLNEDLLLLGSLLLETSADICEIAYDGYFYLVRSGSITKQSFGKAITDTMYNCKELEELVIKHKKHLINKLYQLQLFQARTFIIKMPFDYISQKHKDYVFAINTIKRNRKHIKHGFFSLKDKVFLWLCCVNVTLAKKIAQKI